MSGFTTPGGERFTIFGEGGGQQLADDLDALLGKIPPQEELRVSADEGRPLVLDDPSAPAAQAIYHTTRGIIAATPQEYCRCRRLGPPVPEITGTALPMARSARAAQAGTSADGVALRDATALAPRACGARRRARRAHGVDRGGARRRRRSGNASSVEAFDAKRRAVAAPRFLRNIATGETGWFSSPGLVDLDRDGSLEIVAPQYSTFVFDGEGGAWPGTATRGRVYAPSVVADMIATACRRS